MAAKILIVDDEKLLRQALAHKFESSGYQVFQAENGQTGLDLCHQVFPDIILLDLMMPVMDGKSMLQKLRESKEFKTTPVIIFTNAADINNMMDTQMNYDHVDFLVKTETGLADALTHVQKLLA